MAPKKRTPTVDDASNFVTIKDVREEQTFSVRGKVTSKSGVMNFDCKYS